jgi:hypothetical protein
VGGKLCQKAYCVAKKCESAPNPTQNEADSAFLAGRRLQEGRQKQFRKKRKKGEARCYQEKEAQGGHSRTPETLGKTLAFGLGHGVGADFLCGMSEMGIALLNKHSERRWATACSSCKKVVLIGLGRRVHI